VGKRSNFKRIERDNYPTPEPAVLPLLSWLEAESRFLEPCVGEGVLAGHLKRAGHILVGTYDLPTDARIANYNVTPGAVIVTNPPYWGEPENLHPLIKNLSDQAPGWLLLPADWLFNLSSAAMAPRLRRIVAVGRVKWIPDSPHSGMDNAAWCLFGRPSADEPRFVPRLSRKAAMSGRQS
jgi:hypothetical protein